MQLKDRNIEGQVDDFLYTELNQDNTALAAFCKIISGRALPEIDDAQDIQIQKSPQRVLKNGQTDTGLFFRNRSENVAILIENKVISPFTPRQPERYVEEKKALLKEGRFDKVATVVIAPEKYCGADNRVQLFDGVVPYEEFVALFPGTSIIKKAIDYCEAGWVAEDVPQVSQNFQAYAAIIKDEFPGLTMKTKGKNKPLQSRTIYFHEPTVCSRRNWPAIILNHQWQEGRAKLLFRGWGAFRRLLTPIVERDLTGTALEIDPNRTKSFGLMLPTPVVQNTSGMNQLNEMIEGLSAVQELADWYSTNHQTISRWTDVINRDGK